MYDDELSGLTDGQLLQRGHEAVTPEVQAANSSGSFKLLGQLFTKIDELKSPSLTRESVADDKDDVSSHPRERQCHCNPTYLASSPWQQN